MGIVIIPPIIGLSTEVGIQGVVKIIETPDLVIIIVCNIYFIFSWIDL